MYFQLFVVFLHNKHESNYSYHYLHFCVANGMKQEFYF